MTSKANESIKRTGDLLLSGWRLLNAGCPICNTALLSKGDLLRCPSCDLAVVKESDHQNIATNIEKVTTAPSIAEAKFEIEDDYYQYASAPAGEKFKSLDEAKKLYDLQNKRMNDVSNKLGAKMLEGFSMLSTVCPGDSCRGTPLVRLAAGPMVCVCCDSEYKVSALGDLIATLKTASASDTFNGKITAASVQAASTLPPAPVPTSPTAATNSAAPSLSLTATADEILHASDADNAFFLNMSNAPILDLNAFASHTNADDASSKISRKLMLGWALLDKCCQSKDCAGEVPLMRDLQGKECCVACGFPDAAAARTASAPSSAALASSSLKRSLAESRVQNATADSSDESNNHSESSDSDEDEEADLALFHSYRAAAAAARQPKTTAQPISHASVSHTPQGSATYSRAAAQSQSSVAATSDGSEVSEAVLVLRQKLAETSVALASSHNVESSTRLANLVASLATALKTLQGVELD